MKNISKNAIYLIDGSSFLYRAYYALPPLHSSKGVPVQATYGFCRMIKKVVDDFDPKNLVILWDSRGKGIRSEIYEDYKATRQVAPSDLGDQKEQIMQFANTIGICQISKSGYEADDLIASVVEENKKKDIVIIGSDKDLYQLLSTYVFIYDPFKKEIIDKEKFIQMRGFEPDKLLMYHSILGDSSDNIPGVKGIGKKGAEVLVKQFGTLDNLYENLDKVEKERTRILLKEQKKEAYLSQKLFTLSMPALKETIEDFAFDKDDWSNALDFFVELGFQALIKTVKTSYIQSAIDFQEDVKVRELEESDKEKKEDTNWDCIIVDTDEALEQVIYKIQEADFFALDVETTGLRPMQDELVGLSLACDEKTAYYIPVAHKDADIKQLSREKVLEKFKPILESDNYKKTFHNAKFDRLVLLQYGIDMKGMEFDSLLAANLVRKGWEKIGLKSLSDTLLHEPMRMFTDVLGIHKNFATVPLDIAADYSAHDSLQTYKLKFVLEKILNKYPKIKKIFYDVEIPLCTVLLKMEEHGVLVKQEVLEELGKEVQKELKAIESKILAVIGKDAAINLNSPKQVEKLLFDDLGLPVIKKGEVGKSRSTDQDVLEELSKVHVVPGLILKYRELAKLLGTYIKPLPEHINSKTGRIHTNFSQIDAATGRLASYNPNLQNIPVGAGYGIRVRSAFIAPRNKRFLSADYSQIELRVLAHMTKDKNLVNAFLEDKDIHAEIASQIFGIQVKDVTSEQRKVGKRINFSIMYGLTPYGLSKDLGIRPSEAKLYIDSYFANYPRVSSWMNEVIEEATKNGYVETFLGRRRYFPGLLEENHTIYEQARRAAINTPIQGTAAEIVKLAMLKIDKELKIAKLDAFMILQVHDEIIIELPKDEEDRVTKIVRKCMENIVEWRVPLKVDISVGKNWEQIS